jgi:uncharacterized protein YbjT (DUF2867 family)
MSTKLEIAVVGATGQQGGAVARALLSKGHQVRALTRNTDSPSAGILSNLGAKIVKADLDDRASLVEAFRGADGVFGVTTPYEAGTEVETRQGLTLVDAAKEAGVGHFVFSSVGSADRETGIPHFDSKYEIERHLGTSGLFYTIIGPVFFMENWLGPWFLPSLQQGNVALGMPGDRKLAHIAVEDIGSFAALIFERREEFVGKRIDIAGDDLTGDEIAAAIGARAGRELGFFEIPIEAVREQSEDFAKMYEWFAEVGYTFDLEALKRDYPEVGWTDFGEWVRGQDWSVLDPPRAVNH